MTPSPAPAPDEARRTPHQEWYRLALLLTGDATLAAQLLLEVITTATEQIAHFRNPQSRTIWLVRRLRSKTGALAENAPAPENAAPLPEPLAALRALPEPARSAYLLHHVLDLEPDDLSELLEIRPPAFAKLLQNARQELAKGKDQPPTDLPSDPLVAFHRPWGGDAPRITKALQRAAKKEGEALATQKAIDTRWHEAIGAIRFPANLYLPEFAPAAKPGFRAAVRQPAVLAMACALLVVIGVLILAAMRQSHDFPGKEEVSALVEDSVGGNGVELEGIEPTETGRLADWFLLKGFDDFAVPPELEHAVANGCRVYEFADQTVAQVALEHREALLFVYRKPVGEESLDSLFWHPYQYHDWAVAVRTIGPMHYVIAFNGDSDEMNAFLAHIRLPPSEEEEGATTPPLPSAPPTPESSPDAGPDAQP